MDIQESDEIFEDHSYFGENPPDKVYYQVIIDYNEDYVESNSGEPVLESDPLRTYPDAMKLARNTAKNLEDSIKNSKYMENSGEIANNSSDYTYLLLDRTDSSLIAGIAVSMFDYKSVTIH